MRIALLFMLFFPCALAAQQIEGTVLDELGEPLVGAHCTLKSGKVATTFGDGTFSLPCHTSDTLVVSFIGYEDFIMPIVQCPAVLGEIRLLPAAILLELGVEVNAAYIADNTSASQIVRISPANIALFQAGTAADLLQESGSVYVQKSQQGGGSPVLRGMEANRILLLLDGLRLNNAIFRSGHLQQAMTIDQYLLEEAVALFGPNSLPYGSDAMGGAINFRTISPKVGAKPATGFTAKAATATHEYTAHGHATYGKGKLAALSSLTLSNFGDVMSGKRANPFNGYQWMQTHYVETVEGADQVVANPNPYRQLPLGYRQWNATQKVRWQPNKRWAHGLNMHATTSSDVPRYDRLTQDADGYYAPENTRFAEWYYGPQRRLTGNYSASFMPDGRPLQLWKADVMYQQMEESRISRRLGSLWQRNQVEHVNTLGFKTDAKFKLGQYFLDIGAEAYYDRVRSVAFERSVATGDERAAATRYPDGGGKMLYSGAYTTLLAEKDGWRGALGARVSYTYLYALFQDTAFFQFPFKEVRQHNPSVSGSINVAKRIGRFDINALLSSAFRAPNIDDVGKVFDSRAGNTIILPNGQLRPEQSFNAEIGAAYRAKHLSLEGHAFHNWIGSLIQIANARYQGQDSIVVDGLLTQVQANTNIGQARIYGWNVQAHWRQGPWQAQASMTQTLGRNLSTSDPLGHIPPLFGKMSVSYEKKKWQASTALLFNGWKRWDDMSQLDADRPTFAVINEGYPAWLNWQMRFGYKISQAVGLQLGIDNLLDYHYRTFASGVNAPGRNFMLTISGKF